MGGLAASSARDYAKLGLLYLHRRASAGSEQRPARRLGRRNRSRRIEPHLLPGENPKLVEHRGLHVPVVDAAQNWDGDFLARGIWGQNVYVHPRNRVVIVKLAADQKNFDPRFKLDYIDYLQALAQSLDD